MSILKRKAIKDSRDALYEGQIDLYQKIWQANPVYSISRFMEESLVSIKSCRLTLAIIRKKKSKDDGEDDLINFLIKNLADKIKKLERVRYLIALISEDKL